jgi:hypothetical protein
LSARVERTGSVIAASYVAPISGAGLWLALPRPCRAALGLVRHALGPAQAGGAKCSENVPRGK